MVRLTKHIGVLLAQMFVPFCMWHCGYNTNQRVLCHYVLDL
jgi:hypothetical protein